jgi:hypothetical protein
MLIMFRFQCIHLCPFNNKTAWYVVISFRKVYILISKTRQAQQGVGGRGANRRGGQAVQATAPPPPTTLFSQTPIGRKISGRGLAGHGGKGGGGGGRGGTCCPSPEQRLPGEAGGGGRGGASAGLRRAPRGYSSSAAWV